MKKLMLFLIVFNFISFVAKAQDNGIFNESSPTVLGISFDYGNLLKHTESLRQIDDAYPFAIRLDWSKHLITQESWNFCNCFPRVGVSLAYWDWDNPEVLGVGIVPLAYVEPYFLTQKRINLFVRMGLGGAFLTQQYDDITNPLNESYSTLFNFMIVLGVGVNYRLTDKLNLRLAAKYNHTSNGGVSTPNKGLNFPSLNIGLNTSLEPIEFPSLAKNGQREPPEDKTRWSLVHFSGWSNANVGDKDKFYVLGFLGNYARWVGGRSALTAGTEWIFDYSRKERFTLEGSNAAFGQGAFLGGHEFWLGSVTFSQQLGVYYFKQNRSTDAVYQRYGLSYHFTKHVFAGFNLKAHLHVADFFDFRIGYVF
jgi:hypothetical protein